MPNDSFRFREFTVRQTMSAMKVGTDGVILGSWADVSSLKSEVRVLDIGTGTGLIAMMMAQRNTRAMVDAVEVECGAATEANYNFSNSVFADRLEVFHRDFQSFALECEERGVKYDIIVSNPPYFNGSFKSVDAQRTAARHTELLPTEDLIEGVLRVISRDGGRFTAIFPYSNAAVFVAKAAAKGLYCSRILEIYSKAERVPKRMAAEFTLERRSDVANEKLTILEGGSGGYTRDYRELTKDFYFRF